MFKNYYQEHSKPLSETLYGFCKIKSTMSALVLEVLLLVSAITTAYQQDTKVLTDPFSFFRYFEHLIITKELYRDEIM